jgi:hypothetical protein
MPETTLSPAEWAVVAAFGLATLAALLLLVPLVARRLGIPRRDAKDGAA